MVRVLKLCIQLSTNFLSSKCKDMLNLQQSLLKCTANKQVYSRIIYFLTLLFKTPQESCQKAKDPLATTKRKKTYGELQILVVSIV